MTEHLPTATTVANYILYLGGRDGVDDVDQFKVQKTLYFCQCWSLALRGEPLFAGEVQAWRHGPVVPEVYGLLKDWGDEPIDPVPAPKQEDLNEDDRLFIESVWESCRSYTGRKLAQWTHEPGPWAEVWGDRGRWDRGRDPIPEPMMRERFKSRARSWRGRR